MNVSTSTRSGQSSRKHPERLSFAYRFVWRIGYFLRLRLESQPGLIWRGAMAALAWLLRLHGLTLRYVVNDKPGYFAGRIEGPAIFLLWHNRISGMPAFYERWRLRGRPRAVVLTSASKEGSLLAEVLKHFGLGAIRGSTSRRASVALREMARRIAQGHDIIITPDGPRGPRYRLQAGALYLAQTTGRPIVPLQLEYSRYVRSKSWDGFAIPLPFARFQIGIGDPYWIDASCSDDELETQRRLIEQLMTQSMVMDRPEPPRFATTSLSQAERNRST